MILIIVRSFISRFVFRQLSMRTMPHIYHYILELSKHKFDYSSFIKDNNSNFITILGTSKEGINK